MIDDDDHDDDDCRVLEMTGKEVKVDEDEVAFFYCLLFSFVLDEIYFLLLEKLRQSHQPHRLAGRWHDEKDKEATFHIDARLFTWSYVGVYKCTKTED